jgi:AAA family ATP:ADP antiporter
MKPTETSRQERLRATLACASFFLLLCSYTMLRPVRDEMAVRYGADRLHWLFTGTFIFTLLTVPVFGWVVRRLPRRMVLPVPYAFLVLNLLAFAVLLRGTPQAGTAAAFFVWLSVFNLFIVSLFWSSVSDVFTSDEAHRLYGRIAAGGTAGALAGPAMTAMAARSFGTAYLLVMSAVLLLIAAACMMALRDQSQLIQNEEQQPIGGSVLAGIGLTLRTPQLGALALLVVCLTAVSTVLYVGLVDVVGKTVPQSADRKAFFATLDLGVNILALLLQLLGTRRIVQSFGLAVMLTISPLLLLLGFGAMTIWNNAAGFAVIQVLHRAGEYALNKPGREMIYTTVDPESRFKAKNFIDTAVYRANDAASAWLINAVRAAGWNAIWLVGIPAALLWTGIGFRIGKQHDRMTSGKTSHEPP